MKIFCQNTKSGLQPLYEDDYDEKKKLKIGEIYFCEIKRPRNIKFHRKNTGLNHIAFKVGSKQEVDNFSNNFLSDKKQIILYNSPKEYPEYTEDYYAVFFEDPDRIKLEVMYHS